MSFSPDKDSFLTPEEYVNFLIMDVNIQQEDPAYCFGMWCAAKEGSTAIDLMEPHYQENPFNWRLSVVSRALTRFSDTFFTDSTQVRPGYLHDKKLSRAHAVNAKMILGNIDKHLQRKINNSLTEGN